MNSLLLVGGGEHCLSVIDSIRASRQFEIAGIIDLPEKRGMRLMDIPFIGADEDMASLYQQGITHAFISTGSVGDVSHRRRLTMKVKQIGFRLPAIIDRTSIISEHAKIGEGVFIGKGGIVNAESRIGECAIINSGAIVEHHCKVGAFCHLAPGSVLSGGVTVGDDTHVGVNATVIQQICIGSHTIIGAGSVVVSDIGSNVKAYGNPCRTIASRD